VRDTFHQDLDRTILTIIAPTIIGSWTVMYFVGRFLVWALFPVLAGVVHLVRG
jgi:hypothetical protein